MCHRVRTEATNLHPTHHSIIIIIIIIIITITIRTNSAPGRHRRARRCQSGSEGAGKDIDKYQDLAMELRRLWKVKSKMILIVVWCSRNSTQMPGKNPKKAGTTISVKVASEHCSPRNSTQTQN